MSILKRLRALHEKATPGPWEIDKEDVGDEDFIYIPTGIIGGNGKRVVGSVGGLCSEDCDLGEGELESNAELIALLHNSLPALLEVVEAARELFVALVEISPIEINCPPKADKELNEKANVMRRTLAKLDKEVG